ncbi:hypothetical protein WR25_24530 [Diploscapter pachys]|uniref:Uncharacterized protein n=1 Tax=Diploscapter pachys TaxID=2018661 RepID=A0A2A2JR36_9BILA|nr:hypothetical protein WR25_24530 [Diploscapter pachys]
MFLLFCFASGVAASKLTSYEMKLDELPIRKHSNGGTLVHPSEDVLMDIAYDVFSAAPESTSCQQCWNRAVELRKNLRPTIQMLRHWGEEDKSRLYKKLSNVHNDMCTGKELVYPELCDEKQFTRRIAVIRGESLSKICRNECEKELTTRYV